MKPQLTQIALNQTQRNKAETLNPKDGSEFCVLGQVMVGDDPRAGTLYCYRLNRKQYEAIAKTIKEQLSLS